MSSSDEDFVSGSDSSEDDLRRKKKRSKSKKHKHSKSRKEKKHKKKNRRRRTPSESGSSSSDEWVTKEESLGKKDKVKIPPSQEAQPDATTEKTQREREEWMNFGEMLPTFSNDSKRAQRRAEKEAKRIESAIDQLGQHSRELNPYWKNGGKGLPVTSDASQGVSTAVNTATTDSVVGDGGLSWLRKAFLRAKQQAEEEGKSLEEIAEERWGSLQKFYEMLEEAEEKAKRNSRDSGRESHQSRHHRDDRRRPRFQKPRNASGSDSDHTRRESRYTHRRHDDRRRPNFQKPSYNNSSNSDNDDKSPKRSRTTEDRRMTHHQSGRDTFLLSSTHNRSSGLGWKKAVSGQDSTEKAQQVASKSEELRSEAVEDNEYQDQESQIQNKSDTDTREEIQVLTDKEMNELCAKIIKAEMLGNEELSNKLKAKKEEAEEARKNNTATGQGRPIKRVIKVVIEDKGAGPSRKRDKIAETHKDGERVRYFPDDDKQSLKNMFEREKRNTAADENALFSRLAGKRLKTSEDYTLDDVFMDRASSSKQESKDKERELRNILDEEKVYDKTLENCPWCFDANKLQNNLVIATGEKSFLCLPPHVSLTEGHCLIVPMHHTSSATQLDEDVWREMLKFRKALVDMFASEDQDIVVFESALFLKRHPHMYLECVPMPKETGELAPIYFKKAIQECETEWAQNKKLVDLRSRDVRKAIPKGLPYFFVDFGMDSGFAHVIEDERNFPRNFAQEIIGGMLDLDHYLWRKPKQEDFKAQRSKVMAFLKTWGPYDWTRENGSTNLN